VQVDGHQRIEPAHLQQARGHLGTERLALALTAVLASKAEVGHHCVGARGAGATQGVAQQGQLQQVLAHRRRRGLDHGHRAAAHGLEEAGLPLAVGEGRELRPERSGAQGAGHRLAQRLAGRAGDDGLLHGRLRPRLGRGAGKVGRDATQRGCTAERSA
jgi:hypothetical protein